MFDERYCCSWALADNFFSRTCAVKACSSSLVRNSTLATLLFRVSPTTTSVVPLRPESETWRSAIPCVGNGYSVHFSVFGSNLATESPLVRLTHTLWFLSIAASGRGLGCRVRIESGCYGMDVNFARFPPQ